MSGLITHFAPQPPPGAWPREVPSPFAPAPHPLARRAGDELQVALQNDFAALLAAEPRGKMFGVLVVADADGRVGWLRGFSGMLGGSWHVPGFVPPIFDPATRDTWWPAGEAELRALDDQIAQLKDARARLQAQLTALDQARAAPDSRQQARHERAQHRARRTPIAAALAAIEAQRLATKRQQAARSCELLERLFAGYQIPNARGERRLVREVFAPATPPGGSGDCAAPKLFAHAFAAGLRPLALGEFWWGPPPPTGGRAHGRYYPACRGKCGPTLGFMLQGLSVAPAPTYGGPIGADEPRAVYEDRWLAVVDKPAGLLSVPGRTRGDSVEARLAHRFGAAFIVHRLDLDTSGLLLVAKDLETQVALQRLFHRRAVDKRYIAWLAGDVARDSGRIELALRVDEHDRPRQIHDPRHGRWASTDFRVLERTGGRTRVALFPLTGRSHQLRVHAAHALGLGAAIVGDRLYGQAAGELRLLLHAEALAFTHPHTGARVALELPAPF